MLRFYELAPSPNNVKVRLALRFKGIEFEPVPVDPFDRAPVVEVSGQELTPVIADRGIVLNDSEAILQYLDANHTDSPRLIPPERAGRHTCDEAKRELDRRVVPFWSPVFRYALKRVDELDTDARDRFAEALAWLDGEVAGKAHWKGAELPICDLRIAQWAVYALPGEALVRRVRLFRRFRQLFDVESGRFPNLERFLEPWNERLG